jgi:hypothetical protein
MTDLLRYLRGQGVSVTLETGADGRKKLRCVPWMRLGVQVRREVKKSWKALAEEVAREASNVT